MKRRIVFVFLLVLLCLYMAVSCDLDEKPSGDGTGGTSENGADGDAPENGNGGSASENGAHGGVSSDSSLPCEHSFSEWRITKEATCKEEGVKGRSCRFCSETEIISVPRTDAHTPKSAENGITRCSLCGTTLSDNTYYTLTFKLGNVVVSEERLKAGDEIKNEPTAGGNLSYNWDQKIPVHMPSHDLTITAMSIAGGTAYGNISWSYDFCGTLSIHGSGAMPSYSTDSQPWAAYKNEITALSIASGVTAIGKYAFFDCIHLRSVVIPDTVKTIGDYAFACCESIREITIGASVTSIGKAAFVTSYNLERVTFRGSLVWTYHINNYYTDVTFSRTEIYQNAISFKKYYDGTLSAK